MGDKRTCGGIRCPLKCSASSLPSIRQDMKEGSHPAHQTPEQIQSSEPFCHAGLHVDISANGADLKIVNRNLAPSARHQRLQLNIVRLHVFDRSSHSQEQTTYVHKIGMAMIMAKSGSAGTFHTG